MSIYKTASLFGMTLILAFTSPILLADMHDNNANQQMNTMTKRAMQPTVCKQAFASCASAACIAVPGSKDTALCNCQVKDGFASSNLPCEKRAPIISEQEPTRLVSSFSFEEAQTSQQMTCSNGADTLWASCMDAPCITDPKDPSKAICTCRILHGGTFVTQGGRCNMTTCHTILWSGALAEEADAHANALMKAMDLDHNPIQRCDPRGGNYQSRCLNQPDPDYEKSTGADASPTM